MGKISPVSAKYIIHASIHIEGVVDRPDVIGSVFGQTEGLLGSDLELRELQRSGRVGRIEVELTAASGKSTGAIIIPSSLDKAETALIAASLETIQRIGPCNAQVKVDKLEDIRITKRSQVIERAKELLGTLMHTTLPDSRDIKEEVTNAVRVMEIVEYGKDRLPAGPAVDESDEVIIVEGRADVLNLLKHDFKNCIAMNGTSVPPTIVDLCNRKIVCVFVDGDRGGSLILKELSMVTEIDYVARAPDGKEVEELSKKEIHKSLRGKVAMEQVKMEINTDKERLRPNIQPRKMIQQATRMMSPRPAPVMMQKTTRAAKPEIDNYKKMLDDLMGTKGAYLIDESANILGKVPTSELQGTVRSMNSGIHAIVFDGSVTKEIAEVAEKARVKYLIAVDSKIKQDETSVEVLTNKDF